MSSALPDNLAEALEGEAHRRHVSVSELVWDALAAHVGLVERPRGLPFAALGASGHRTTARDLEDVLAIEWGDGRRR